MAVTMRQLASELTKENSKKAKVQLPQVREVLKSLSLKVYKDPSVTLALLSNGKRLSKG